MGVAKELGLRDKLGTPITLYDIVTYRKFPDGGYLLGKLGDALKEIPTADAVPGDLGVFLIEGNPQHLAILTDYDHDNKDAIVLGMIHCDAHSKQVVEHRLDEAWRSRLVKVFRFN